MARRPNILFITSHDLGRHLGCYGQSTVTSPNLDALAAEGVRFANHFGTAPQCSPSRSGLHTGRYPPANGVMGLSHADFAWDLYQDERHAVSYLNDAGYRTALLGIQHVTPDPERLGYDELLGRRTSAKSIAAGAVDYLARVAEEDDPFYLEVGFFEPHRPYDHGGVQPDAPLGVDLPGYVPECPEAEAEFAALQGAIRALDDAVGTILESLSSLGLEEETWVIFTVDHGIAMPRAKCTLYDPGVETALLMRWPAGGLTGGQVIAPLISNVDVLPTMLDALDLPVPDRLQGRSFWPLLDPKAGTYAARTEIFVEETFHSFYHPQRAVRTETHKLIAHLEKQPAVEVPGDVIKGDLYLVMAHDLNAQPREPFELYNLETDPWEQENLAGRPEVAGLEAALKATLWRWMMETGDPLVSGPIASPFYTRTLRALQETQQTEA